MMKRKGQIPHEYISFSCTIDWRMVLTTYIFYNGMFLEVNVVYDSNNEVKQINKVALC